ncbi:hypothetical protein ACN28G_24730 [Micromonospora sp. WMMA1923]|uniref:hypothetical protein n=1 Tax=Micromonospora sp. WMMA1923 TaxID=3404125 RepID=UPI003B93538D
MTGSRRAGLVVVGVLAGTVGVPGPAASAAGSAGYCPDASGVTVVVDFNELGGGTVVRCAPGAQSTGLTALKDAGFQVTGTLRWGEGFICRIEGKPSAAAEKCVDTPPASAYWSYWHAQDGGSWAYSDKGVLNRRPPAGSFEGWSFSLNRSGNDAPRPDVAPKRPAPPPPAPPPPGPVAPPPGPVAPPPAGDDGPVAPPPPAADGGPVVPPAAGSAPVRPPPAADGRPAPAPTAGTTGPAPPTGTPPTGAPTPSGAAPTAPASGAGTSADPAGQPPLTPIAGRRDGGGLPLGTVAGVLVLAVLAAGGLVAARRRRTAEPDD